MSPSKKSPPHLSMPLAEDGTLSKRLTPLEEAVMLYLTLKEDVEVDIKTDAYSTNSGANIPLVIAAIAEQRGRRSPYNLIAEIENIRENLELSGHKANALDLHKKRPAHDVEVELFELERAARIMVAREIFDDLKTGEGVFDYQYNAKGAVADLHAMLEKARVDEKLLDPTGEKSLKEIRAELKDAAQRTLDHEKEDVARVDALIAQMTDKTPKKKTPLDHAKRDPGKKQR